MNQSNEDSSMGNHQRPKRDVSARSAIGECDHCGGNAHSLLGGEHIWKCSEIVPVELVEQLAEEWEEQRTGDEKTDRAFERAAERLREEVGAVAE